MDALREAWRPRLQTEEEREKLTKLRWMLAAAVVTGFVLLMVFAPISATQRNGVLLLIFGSVSLSTMFELRRQEVPLSTAVIDTAGGMVNVGIAAVAPPLFPLALASSYISLVSATSRGGFFVGLPAFVLMEVGFLVAALYHGLLVGDWVFVAAGHVTVGLTLLAAVSVLVEDRAKQDASRERIDAALEAFGRHAVDGAPIEAVRAAVEVVLDVAEVVEVAVHSQDDEDWTVPDGPVRRRVRLVPGPAGGLVTEVRVPMAAGGHIVGCVTVLLRRAPSTKDVQALGQLTDRLAVAVLSQSAHRNERRARIELERAETVRDEVLARVTHDLRAPLSTITGSVFTLLEHSDQLDESSTRLLYELLGRNADRVTNWVQSLLEGAMQGEQAELAPRPVALDELLRDGAETAAHHLAEHELVVEAPTVTVEADPVAVTRVLANLLGNASKYAPPGSRIELSARRRGDEISIVVADHGSGMDAETAAHVFEPFYRSPDQPAGVHGTGLGLATVRDLVMKWGGRVGVSETPGGGATFWFTVPLADDTVVPLQRGASA